MTTNTASPTRALLVTAVLVVGLLGASCAQSSDSSGVVRVLTHQDFHLPEQAITEFEQSTGVKVVVQRMEDRAAVVNLLTRWGSNPVADVVIGVDTLDRQRVIAESLVEPYVSLQPETIDPALRVPNDWLTPVSYLDACLNYQPSAYFQPIDQQPNTNIDNSPLLTQIPDEDSTSDQLPEPPNSLNALADQPYATQVLLPDASTSRMGMYLLLALERLYPEGSETAWPQQLNLLLRSGVELAPTWEEAYFEGKSLAWGSSGMPAVYAQYQPNLSHQSLDEIEVDLAVVPNDCVRIVNYAGVVAGTDNRRTAGLFMELVSSPEFQYSVGDRFGSRPARADILRTPYWREFGVAVEPIELDPAYVGANWEIWRLTWSQIMRSVALDEDPIEPEVTVTLPN